MKKVKDCITSNCIPTPVSCVDWDMGDIEFLGICNGDGLGNVILEMIGKLQDLGSDDLSSFDIDSLLDICNQKAPTEITTLSIFNIIRVNEICLNDKITTLSEQIAEISHNTALNVNLKCFIVADNLGNVLSIDRDGFDQLLVDNLCLQKDLITGLQGSVISLQSQINNINLNTTVDELSFATCINGATLPTSTQVINTSSALCNMITSIGTTINIASALAKTPGDLNTEFGLISGWNLAPSNWAANYGNLLLEVENLRQRVIFMENNCCASSCDDVKLGFTAIYNEDNTGIIIRFTSGAGTSIPAGFADLGSTGTITDIDGNVETFNIDIVDNFGGNETDVIISGLNLTGDLEIDITAKLGTESLTCEKCLHKLVKQANCAFCEICASGNGSIVIIYESSSSGVVIENSSTTTSTSTTTTTTLA